MKAIILILVLFIYGCQGPVRPVRVDKTTNPELPVEKLFEKEGYTVYRFQDNDRYHYFVLPQGQVTSTWSESCGKGCVQQKEETIPTPKKVIKQ